MAETELLYEKDLDSLRQGMFAPSNRGKLIETTEEGIPVSKNLLKNGFVTDDEIERFPGVTHQKGIHPVIECTQNIPCNPCQDACVKHCIKIGQCITSLPVVVSENCGCTSMQKSTVQKCTALHMQLHFISPLRKHDTAT